MIREVKEEIGLTLKEADLKLIKVVENFFTLNGKKFHELLFIYKINNNEYFKDKKEIKVIDKSDAINKWYNIPDLNSMDIRPQCVINSLNNNEITHYILKN